MASERRGQTLLAWAVILALVGVMLIRPARHSAADGMDEVQERLQGRYLIGLKALGMDLKPLLEQARPDFQKTPLRQIAFVVLVAEIAGKEAAETELESIEPVTDDEDWAAELVGKLIKGEELEGDDDGWLVRKLGWYGRLALARQDEALHAALVAESRRVLVVLLGALGLGVLGLLLGLGVAVAAGFAAYQGWVADPPLEGDRGGVYAETFAVYLALFIGLSFLASLRKWGDWSFGLSGVLMLFSLVALSWPGLRGVKWSQVREDVGLKGSWLDIPGGVATYLGALPLLVVGVLISVTMTMTLKLFKITPGTPSHPVAEAALGVPWWVWVQIFVVACVCAPVVEEVFFRGVLYAHLSRLGKSWPRAGRVAFAVGVSSFLFAAIHPQGWLAVPILSALATAFALAREWRGGIVPGMIAHAINNGIALLVLYLAVA